MALVRLFQSADRSVLELKEQLREQHYHHCQHWSPLLRHLIERMETLLQTVCFLDKRAYPESAQCLQLLLWCTSRRMHHTFSCTAASSVSRRSLTLTTVTTTLNGSRKCPIKLQSNPNQANNKTITQQNMHLTIKVVTLQQMMCDLVEQRLASVQRLVRFPVIPQSISLRSMERLAGAAFYQRNFVKGVEQNRCNVLRCAIWPIGAPSIEVLPPSPTRSQSKSPSESAPNIQLSQLPPTHSDSSSTPPNGTTTSSTGSPSHLSPQHASYKKKWKGSGERYAALPVAKRLSFTEIRIHEVAEEILLIASDIKQSTCLRKLDLSSSDIGDEGAIAIAQEMKHSTSLTKLSLGYNEIGIRGALAIAKAIRHSTSLTKINLSSNDFGNAGAMAIASSIKRSKNLVSISLANNEITSRGTQAIAEAIKLSTSLSCVDLKFNHIRTAGAAAIAECIQQSSVLKEIDLSNTNMGGVGLSMIQRAMQANPTVKVIV